LTGLSLALPESSSVRFASFPRGRSQLLLSFCCCTLLNPPCPRQLPSRSKPMRILKVIPRSSLWFFQSPPPIFLFQQISDCQKPCLDHWFLVRTPLDPAPSHPISPDSIDDLPMRTHPSGSPSSFLPPSLPKHFWAGNPIVQSLWIAVKSMLPFSSIAIDASDLVRGPSPSD